MYGAIVILLLVSALVFAVPARAKAWFTLAAVSAAAIVAGLASAGIVPVARQIGSASIDGLSVVFLIIITIAGISALIYSRGYIRSAYSDRPAAHLSLHYFALAALILSMMMVVICRDGFRFLVWWELMTLASFLLILFEPEKQQVRRAALTYLVMMHIGFVLLIWGFAKVYAAGLPVSLDSLAAYFSANAPLPLFVIFLAGFGMKAGMFPLHGWLPDAHPAAPAHVSGLMSGVMIKMGVYGILRVACATGDAMGTAGMILFVIGIVTGLWGVLSAAIQNDIKRLLAYSSIENIGIILMAAGFALYARAGHNDMLALCAMTGAILHMANHAMFKPLLFFGAGNVYTQTHTTAIDKLGGLAKRMPLTAGMFLLGTMAICALPPLSGFVSEFMVFLGMLEGISSGRDILVSLCGLVALALTGGIVMIAFAKLYGIVFLGSPRSGAADRATEADRTRIAAGIIPSVAIIAVGLLAPVFIGAIFTVAGDLMWIGNAESYFGAIEGGLWNMAAVFVTLIFIIGIIVLLRARAMRRRTISESPTWGCGFGAPSPRMQYTGESYTEGLRSIASGITGSVTHGGTVSKSDIFPGRKSFSVGHRDKIARLFSAWWVELIRFVNRRVMRMRTGKVNYYILYALGFLAFILILSVLGLI